MNGAAIWPTSELTTIRVPARCRRNTGSATRATWLVPWMAVSTTASNTAAGTSSTFP